MTAMICEVTFHHTSDIEIFCICKQENCVLGLSNDFSLLGSIRPFNLTRLEGSKEKQQDLKWPNFSKGSNAGLCSRPRLVMVFCEAFHARSLIVDVDDV